MRDRRVAVTPFLPPFAVFTFTRPLFFPDDLGNALYQTDGAVIIIYVDVSGHDDFVPLERRLEFRGNPGVKGGIEHLRNDSPEALRGGLGEVAAVPGGVEHAAPEPRQPGEDVKHDELLNFIRNIAKLKEQHAREAHVLPPLRYPKGCEVALAREVLPGVGVEPRRNPGEHGGKFRLAPVAGLGFLKVIRKLRPCVRPLEAQDRHVDALGAFDECRRDVRPRAVPGNDEKFLVRVFPIKGDNIFPPCAFRFWAPLLPLREADSAVQPVSERIVEGDFDKLIRLVSLPYFFTQQVERVGVPVMRRDDHDFAAPHEQGERRLHDLAKLIMESRFVEDDHALTPTKRTGAGGERHDFITGSENDAVGEDVVR